MKVTCRCPYTVVILSLGYKTLQECAVEITILKWIFNLNSVQTLIANKDFADCL